MGYASLTEYGDTYESDKSPASVQRALDAASDYINEYTGRTFTVDTSTSKRIFYGLPSLRDASVRIPMDDCVSVDGVECRSRGVWGALDADTYQVEPLNAPVHGSVYTSIYIPECVDCDLFRVNAQWGWSAVPAAIVVACIEIASILLVEGVRATQVETTVSSEDTTEANIQPAVQDMLISMVGQYKRVSHA